MKMNLGVLVLIASLGLFAALASANGDPGMQQSNESSNPQQMNQQGAMTSDPQMVKQVQQALSMQGYDPGPADGKWSSKTQSALRKFQQAQGMPANGQLDRQTLASLGISGSAAGGQQPSTQDQQRGAGGQQGGMPDQQSGGQQGGSKY